MGSKLTILLLGPNWGYYTQAFHDPSLTVRPQANFIFSPALDSNSEDFQQVVIDDLVCTKDGETKHYTIKQSNSKGNWSLSQLKSEGVLSDLKEQHEKSPDSDLILVSQTGSSVLSQTLSIAATIEDVSLLDQDLSIDGFKEWNRLKSILGYDDLRLQDFAKKVNILVLPLESIKVLVNGNFQGHVTSPELVGDLLYQYVIELVKSNRAANQSQVRDYLGKKGISLKSHLSVDDLNSQLNSASISLIDTSYEFNFLEDTHIEREETQDLYEWITNPLNINNSFIEDPIALLVGEAGMGKTVVLRDLYLKLKDEKIIVVGIKADKVFYQNNLQFLSELRLSEDVEKILAKTSDYQERQVVIVDQIDALSLSLSTDKTQLTNYTTLIARLSNIPNTRIIISCRSFDLNNDPSFRKYQRNKTIRINKLKVSQVQDTLRKANLFQELISSELLELLRVPLHLDVFCRLSREHTKSPTISTLHDLYNLLWEKIILNQVGSMPKIINLIKQLTNSMYEQQLISIPDIFINKYSKEITYAQSQNLVICSNNKLSFFHQTFFDYAFARFFVEDRKVLSEELLQVHQGLFIRSKVKAILSYLKGYLPAQYTKEVKSILFHDKIRFHLKALIINFLGSERELIHSEKKLCYKLLEEPELEELFLESIRSEEWLIILDSYFLQIVQSGDTAEINKLYQLYIRNIENFPNTIFRQIRKLPQFEGRKLFISRITYYKSDPENTDFLALFDEIKEGFLYQEDRFTLFGSVSNVMLT